MHAALGGGGAYFDHRLFYKEATANVTFESYLEGALHSVRVRSGYRSYNDGFPSDDGFYADVTGKFSFPNAFNSGALMIVTPLVPLERYWRHRLFHPHPVRAGAARQIQRIWRPHRILSPRIRMADRGRRRLAQPPRLCLVV